MLVTMYSLKPFDISLRTSFEIPAWAYSDDPEDFKLFEDYMKSLTVFRYDDSDTKSGDKYIMYPINIKLWDTPLPTPFRAYMNSVYVDDNFQPIRWPNDDIRGHSRAALLAKNPITSDMMAWTAWNAPVNVLNYTETMIKREVVTSKLDPTLKKSNCFQPKNKYDIRPLEFKAPE